MTPVFFPSSVAFRRWLVIHHQTATELWVGFYKKQSGQVGVTYDEAVEQALCFGWIDGIKKRVDEHGYTHRFTPRRPKSVWSRINIQRIKSLKRRRLMKPAGLKAFGARDPSHSSIYSFENPARALDASLERRFKANKNAWSWFEKQRPSYRRVAVFWVMSAKKDETRIRRLDRLIAASAKGRLFGPG